MFSFRLIEPPINLDLDKVDQEWVRVLTLLTTEEHLKDEEISNEQHRLTLYFSRLFTLEYFVKLTFDKRLKLHAPHRNKHSRKPLGQLWWNIYSLCNRFSEHSSYSSAEWFGKIYVEGIVEGLNTENTGKQDIIKIIQQQNKKLRSIDDPFENPFQSDLYPETHKLINHLMEASKQSEEQRKAYHVPFMKARSNLVKFIQSNCISVRSDEEETYVLLQGKTKIKAKMKEDIGLKSYLLNK